MDKLKCLIIDDEPLAQDIIENYLRTISYIEIVGKCSDAVFASQLLKNQSIDLLFLDISMPFISGIDFIKTLRNPPKIILTTAYVEYAMEGFELNVVDYLLKPISFERFLKAINKLDVTTKNDFLNEPLKNTDEAFIYVKADYRNIKIILNDIILVESSKDTVIVHTKEKTVQAKMTISAIELRLPENFIRIHRSFIINKSKITAFTQHDFEVDNRVIPIGRSYKANAQRLMREFENRSL